MKEKVAVERHTGPTAGWFSIASAVSLMRA